MQRHTASDARVFLTTCTEDPPKARTLAAVLARTLAVACFVVYPAIVYPGIIRWNARYLALVMACGLGVILVATLKRAPRSEPRVVGVLALAAPPEWWAWHTGGVTYVLMGLLFATERIARLFIPLTEAGKSLGG